MDDRRYGDTGFGRSLQYSLPDDDLKDAIFRRFQLATAEHVSKLLHKKPVRSKPSKSFRFFNKPSVGYFHFETRSSSNEPVVIQQTELRHYIMCCFCKGHSFTNNRRVLCASFTVIYKVAICGLHARRMVTAWHGSLIGSHFAACTTFYGLSAL